jgi:hypothetical protein
MDQAFKMTTEIPAAILTPDSVDTRLGTLRFFDGFPDEETVQKVFDNLDFQRGVEAFLTSLAPGNSCAIREGYRSFGPDNQTLLMTESLMDARTIYLVANTETVYNMTWLDTKDGPLVIEMPPDVLGFMSDFWSRYVTDVGRVGPDRGAGGKYLLLPPGYEGEVPDGFFVLHSRTYGNALIFRGFMKDGSLRSAIEATKRHYRVYPLDRADAPPPMEIIDVSGKYMNTIAPADATMYDLLATVVHEEPLEAVDPDTRGLLAAVGIRKDAPFAPDERMRAILAEAAAVGNATARAMAFHNRDPRMYYYPDAGWTMGFYADDVEFSPGGVLDLDARTYFFQLTCQITPALWVKMVGAGSQYAVGAHDAQGRYLDGGKSYCLHLPPDVPAKDFWSVLVYDPQTRSMLQTDQRFPSVSSQKEDLAVNEDGSVDVYFGPEPPAGHESNWIQTVPGKGWFCFFRLYGPLESWFDKSWRPGEIEPVE